MPMRTLSIAVTCCKTCYMVVYTTQHCSLLMTYLCSGIVAQDPASCSSQGNPGLFNKLFNKYYINTYQIDEY